MSGKTKYKEEYDNIAEVACREGGFTDNKLAKLFGVCAATITNWKRDFPTFLASIKKGKDDFDTAGVEDSLLTRATGFHYKETIMEPDEDGELKVLRVVKKKALPDTTAQIFWLKNRQPKRWRDKQQLEHSGPDGGPIEKEIKIDADITLSEAQALYDKIVSDE